MNTNASSQIQKLLEILQDESIVDVLSIVHKTMLPFYGFYSNSRMQMNFEGFQKFCVDFGIFPDILSKPKIFRFFKTLANFYQEAKLPGSMPPQNQVKPRGRVLSPETHETDFTLKDRPQFSNNVKVTPANQQTE